MMKINFIYFKSGATNRGSVHSTAVLQPLRLHRESFLVAVKYKYIIEYCGIASPWTVFYSYAVLQTGNPQL